MGDGDYIKLENNKRIHQVAPRGQFYVYDSVLFVINDMAVNRVNKSPGDWVNHFTTSYTAFLRDSMKTANIQVKEDQLQREIKRALPDRDRLIYIESYLYEHCWEPADRMLNILLFAI